MGAGDPIFEPFDFQKLQDQANAGLLDCLLAFTSDGQVTAYAPAGAETQEEPQGYAQEVRGPLVYASYYKCKGGKRYYCYIDQNGDEKCKDTCRPC